MLNKIDFYYFSPTGGTRKAGEFLADGISENVNPINLGKEKGFSQADGEMAVVAAPVFGGRIPAFVAEKLKKVDGGGKRAVTLAVYGVRAYEDALVELNDAVSACGFQIIASAALVAQHSIVPAVGEGRPDEQDAAEIRGFAQKVLEKLETDPDGVFQVPGNRPYKQWGGMPAAPVSLPTCKQCKKCVEICPTEAISVKEDAVETDVEKCMLCMACTAICSERARILPSPLQEKLEQKLGPLKDVRRANEFYL